MPVERGDWNPGQRPNVVEVHFARQHVKQGLIGRWFGHFDDQLALMACRRAKAGRTSIRVAGDTERILPRRNCCDARIERRANRKQVASRFKRLRARFMFAIDP